MDNFFGGTPGGNPICILIPTQKWNIAIWNSDEGTFKLEDAQLEKKIVP
jgi:hypothetical protein